MPAEVQPGDLIGLSAALRTLMAEHDRSAHLLDRGFTSVSMSLEELAVPLRSRLQETADGLFRFLEELEKTPEYQRQKEFLNGHYT
jgi:hypothetical protein